MKLKTDVEDKQKISEDNNKPPGSHSLYLLTFLSRPRPLTDSCDLCWQGASFEVFELVNVSLELEELKIYQIHDNLDRITLRWGLDTFSASPNDGKLQPEFRAIAI